MHSPTRHVLLGTLCISVLAASKTCHAQIGVTKPSLEWLIAASDVVVRGTVTDLSSELAEPQVRGTESQWVWNTATLNVAETLKGKHRDNVTFVLRNVGGDETLKNRKGSQHPLLCFLVYGGPDAEARATKEGEIPARHDLKLLGGSSRSVVQLGARPTEERIPPPIFAMDLTVLKSPDEILRAARSAVAGESKRGRIHSHHTSLPRNVMERAGSSGDANHLVVPINHRLEALAREWIKSPEAFLPLQEELQCFKKDDPLSAERHSRSLRERQRYEGVKALGYFKSDENIAILMDLLDDNASWIEHSRDDLIDARRVYGIRREAYKTLRKWGVEVRKPAFTAPLPDEEPDRNRGMTDNAKARIIGAHHPARCIRRVRKLDSATSSGRSVRMI